MNEKALTETKKSSRKRIEKIKKYILKWLPLLNVLSKFMSFSLKKSKTRKIPMLELKMFE